MMGREMGRRPEPERKPSIPAPLKPDAGGHCIRPHAEQCGDIPAIPDLERRTGLAPKRQGSDAWIDSYVPDIKGVIEGDEAF